MKAVFLDRDTFSPQLDLPAPAGVLDWQVYGSTPADEALLRQRLQDADIVITNKVVLKRELLAACPRLKLVQISATGVNNVDAEACRDLGITMLNVAGYSTESVVEHSLMLLLAALRALPHYQRAAVDGTWQASKRFCLVDEALHDAHGKRLLIVGGGAIGQRMKSIAEALGMEVVFAERRGKAPRNGDYCRFEEGLATADVISLHCPLTPETENLMNADSLALCQRRPLIINAARGGVVDSAALVAALEENRILGYASDVLPQEPPGDDEALLRLKGHPRVILTPHNAWASVQAQQKLWRLLSQQVTDFIQNHAGKALPEGKNGV